MVTCHKSFALKPGPQAQIRNPWLSPVTATARLGSSHLNPSPLRLHQKPRSPSSPPMALFLLRPKHRSVTNPSLIHLFSYSSSSSSTPPDDPFTSQTTTDSQSQSPPPSPQQQQSSISSYFSDIKAKLKRQQQQQNTQTENQPNRSDLRLTNSSLSKPTSKVALEEITRNLSDFRRRSAVPSPTDVNRAPPASSEQQQLISFQELYKRSMNAKSRDDNSSVESSPSGSAKGNLSYQAIRESLLQLGSNRSGNTNRRSGELSAFKSSLRLKPVSENDSVKSTVIGGTQGLPVTVFGNEKKKEDGRDKEGISTEFVKMYSYGELGDKLRTLRPQIKQGDESWFSLVELNDRLRKLREMEEKETELKIGGITYKDLRESLVRAKMSDEDRIKRSSVQGLNVLGQLGATPSFALHPPKEHLVEKYFHPDNMSSSEKLKIELAKVRDEFKMAESDCGSTRVQVAQLTLKIKHLSSVLHKKDKHSRKGLQAMVQRRKKLLKYLRRTDWDSYCFVLSKLGLRDNPDYKNMT